MERLTNKREADAQREEYERRLANGYPRNIPEERFLRLAAYEDTHMMPADVMSMRMDMAIITALLHDCDVDRMRELAEADKDGRLVVLPFSDADDVEMQMDGITYKSDHWNILLTAFADNDLTLSGRKIGIFSVEEAEKALEAMKDD